MNKVFLDTDYQHFFEKNGFLLINKQIINDELLSEFCAIRNLLNSEKIDRIQKDFFVGLEHPDKQKVEQINFEINNRIAPILNDFIIDYSPFLSSFISKQPNKDADVFPHQDWSFTDDENLNYAITCWIPLQDTTVDNGCMGLIKGSHLFFNNIRFSPPVATHPSPMSKHKSWILPYFQWLPMVAGSILFFDYRIFHASLPNISNSERLAIGCWLVHKKF
ncbi:MAG: phytanoyl-CoA dioxygenase family protein [Chitinophagales bacterium]